MKKIYSIFLLGLCSCIASPIFADSSPKDSHIQLVEELSKVKLYPNPASNSFHIKVKNSDSPLLVNIYDATGTELLNIPISFDGNDTYSLDISTLTRGIYIVTTHYDNEVATTRLVVN